MAPRLAGYLTKYRRRLVLLCLSLLSIAILAEQPRPAGNYMLHCQGCHRADGSGIVGSVPPLENLPGSFLATAAGREFLVQAPGSSQSSLSDAELAELLNWILVNFSEAELPKSIAPYTAEEVGRIRANPVVDISILRQQVLPGSSDTATPAAGDEFTKDLRPR